jgi:hypothetical protein
MVCFAKMRLELMGVRREGGPMKRGLIKHGITCLGMFFFSNVLFFSSFIRSHPINISFDQLFPVGWYQKTMQSLAVVWHILTDTLHSRDHAQLFPMNSILAQLALARFYSGRIAQEKVVLIDEDREHVRNMVHKVKEMVDRIVVGENNEDFIECVNEFLGEIEEGIES